MHLVYVAGPYRAKTTWLVDRNIRNAREWGAAVVECGAYPVIPHSNTAHFDGLADDVFWLEGTKELLRRCDAILMINGWELSTGASGELAEAQRLGLPVFYCEDMQELREWVRAA